MVTETDCAAPSLVATIAREKIGEPVRSITLQAAWAEATGTVPAHCRIDGVFALQMGQDLRRAFRCFRFLPPVRDLGHAAKLAAIGTPIAGVMHGRARAQERPRDVLGRLAQTMVDIDGSAVVEIYTRIYLRRAGMTGVKLRSRADLNHALKGLGSAPARLRFEPNDHQTDALVTAAGMRRLAMTEPRAFDPLGLTPEIARTEGWTFGVL
jgi:hypothetical protein